MKSYSIKKYHLTTWFTAAVVLFFMVLGNLSFAIVTNTANFSWLPNTETDLAGYKIRYGTTPDKQYTLVVDIGNPTPIDGRIKGSVSGLEEGVTYYFVATAYNSSGLESDYSDEAIYQPSNKISAPASLRFGVTHEPPNPPVTYE